MISKYYYGGENKMVDRNLIKYTVKGIKLAIIILLFTQIHLSVVWAIDPLSREGVSKPQKQEKKEEKMAQQGYELPDIPPPPEVSQMMEKKQELKKEVIQRRCKQESVTKETEKSQKAIVIKERGKQLVQGDIIIPKNQQEEAAVPVEKRSGFPFVLIVVMSLIALALALHIHWSSR